VTGDTLVRPARRDDLNAICSTDPDAGPDSQRRERIARGIDGGEISVAESDGRIVGYALLVWSFFARPFIELVVIDPACRGHGVGPLLIRSVEAGCSADRLFTSTNESNAHMRHVLEKLGYERSGVVHHLDPGDPELVYSKALRGTVA